MATQEELSIGTRVRALRPQYDEDDGVPRTAPVGMVGEIVSVDDYPANPAAGDYPAQGLTYGVVFSNGCWVFLLVDELDDIEVIKG